MRKRPSCARHQSPERTALGPTKLGQIGTQQRRCERRQLVALQSTPFSVAMPHDPRTEWVGPIPTDPLEHVCEYKLGFDDDKCEAKDSDSDDLLDLMDSIK